MTFLIRSHQRFQPKAARKARGHCLLHTTHSQKAEFSIPCSDTSSRSLLYFALPVSAADGPLQRLAQPFANALICLDLVHTLSGTTRSSVFCVATDRCSQILTSLAASEKNALIKRLVTKLFRSQANILPPQASDRHGPDGRGGLHRPAAGPASPPRLRRRHGLRPRRRHPRRRPGAPRGGSPLPLVAAVSLLAGPIFHELAQQMWASNRISM
jgi:hypothetical protein